MLSSQNARGSLGVFNNLRMKLCVIRSGQENPNRVEDCYPRCEIASKELSSTSSIGIFVLVRLQLLAVSQ
jgi:hypothetical protein